ncbi:MAG: N-acetyltransferase [Pseudomonadota bacterium]
MTIRPEASGDEETIHALTEAAFKDMPFSDGDEQHVVDRLRKDADLTLSLVAEDSERIVGHIAFSPVTISDAPRNKRPAYAAMVELGPHRDGPQPVPVFRAIAEMRVHGAKGIVLLGSNEYYPRFGFEHFPQLAYPGPPPEYFQALLFEGKMPSGKVDFAPGFNP